MDGKQIKLTADEAAVLRYVLLSTEVAAATAVIPSQHGYEIATRLTERGYLILAQLSYRELPYRGWHITAAGRAALAAHDAHIDG